MFERLQNIKCPSCSSELDGFNARVIVKRENPTWKQVSHYYVHRCKYCSAKLRIGNQPKLFSILFLYVLVSGVLYFSIYDYSKLFAGIAMLIVVIPFLFLAEKHFQLIEDET